VTSAPPTSSANAVLSHFIEGRFNEVRPERAKTQPLPANRLGFPALEIHAGVNGVLGLTAVCLSQLNARPIAAQSCTRVSAFPHSNPGRHWLDPSNVSGNQTDGKDETSLGQRGVAAARHDADGWPFD
jgi:hypothetical protein